MSKTEDEEVFEEIRRLRLERGRLLQKIKGLEQQQHSAHSALEEVLHPPTLHTEPVCVCVCARLWGLLAPSEPLLLSPSCAC